MIKFDFFIFLNEYASYLIIKEYKNVFCITTIEPNKTNKNNMDILTVRNLTVQFRSTENEILTAVNSLSFDVKKGEILAIVGESGSGKSVTARSIMRLNSINEHCQIEGEILFAPPDKQPMRLDQEKESTLCDLRGAQISMIFQEPMSSLNPALTIGQQLIEPLCLHQKMSKHQANKTIISLLTRIRIPDAEKMLSRYPHQLSGGMRQRVMIAMALSCRPALLIADEPTTALDVTIQSQILALLQELQQEMGMSIIFVTHDMGVVAEIADRVLVMHQGQFIESGSTKEIFASPKHPYTQQLLASVPRLGDMKGTDIPAKFNLFNTTQIPNLTTHSVDYTQPPILNVNQLTTRFDLRSGLLNRVTKRVHAVEAVKFSLYHGETLSLVGESGCGKSTTARSLLQLVQTQSANIEFCGKPVNLQDKNQLNQLRKDIQFVFQDPLASLNPRLTIGYSIMEPLLLHKVCDKKQAEYRVHQLLERVGLHSNHAKRYPHEFSGGQRQRICIARSLALNPKIIIADEAVSALDVSIQAQVINLLLDIQKEYGISYLFISHDMAVVERISHRVAVMYLGQIVETGMRREIFENPQHPYTQKLISAVPIADPSKKQNTRTLIVDEIASPIRSINNVPHIHSLYSVSNTHFVAKSI